MSDYDRGLVDKLKDKLYKRGTYKADLSRSTFSQPHEEVKDDWQHNPDTLNKGVLHPTFLKKFFFFALVFFVLALAASAYVVFTGSNVISTDNLDLEIKGPTAIKAGDDLSLALSISNRNTTNLEAVDLIVTYPPGTREAGSLEKPLSTYRKNLGTIKAGQVVNEQLKSALFGEAGKETEIKVALEYRTAGSNAIFETSKVYKILLSAAPLNVALSMPEELRAGNQIELDINVSADTANPLSDVLVSVDYPSGFQFKSSSPKPVFGNNVWDLGTVSGGGKRTIHIVGVLSGQDGEKKFFQVTAGTPATDKESEVGVPYGGAMATVLMRSSFVNFDASISGSSDSEIVSDPAKLLRADLSWTNNLPDRMINGKVTVSFSGNALDQASVSPGKGFYSSLDNTITWMQQHDSKLAIMEPGSNAHINFDFNTLSFAKLNALGVRNPYVTLKINFSATRVIDGNPGETVDTSITRTVKLNSHLGLVGRAAYNGTPFVNIGPLPPRVNKETTYTVIWSVVNSSNALDDVSVKATLPSQAQFLSNISPAGTDIHFDATTGQITWNIGRLDPSASESPVREVAFQIKLVPSAPQLNQTLPLITNAVIEGRDLFTGMRLSDTLPLIDTRIYTDPSFMEEWAKVAP